VVSEHSPALEWSNSGSGQTAKASCPAPLRDSDTAGIYIHIPFCRSKCVYCDFCSFPGLERLYAPYVDAICREVAECGPVWQGERFDTLFIGGGTPSLLAPAQIGQMIAACRKQLGLADEAEITLEANPGTVTLAALQAIREAGVNRLSLGVQSLHDGELATLGRIHRADEAVAAYRWAREAGLRNINLDLIYGLPQQELASWRATLEAALACAPEHLSLYALTVEEGTQLAKRIAAGDLPAPDDDLAATMYELSEALLDEAGYDHYEISNWARRSAADVAECEPTLACKHNLKYWRNQRYLGLGSAAVSYDGRCRSTHSDDPPAYIARLLAGDAPQQEVEEADRSREIGETMMLGLRLVRGVGWEEFAGRFGVSLRDTYGAVIDSLVADGLLETDARGIRLTARGRLLGNQAFVRFLGP
jgi:oxygen-independent coproporphyrinogen III oxidase